MGGDLGPADRPILRDPEMPAGPDVLVLESTYGDRLHGDDKTTTDAWSRSSSARLGAAGG
jgi:metallo-beta-lactamase family protein